MDMLLLWAYLSPLKVIENFKDVSNIYDVVDFVLMRGETIWVLKKNFEMLSFVLCIVL